MGREYFKVNPIHSFEDIQKELVRLQSEFQKFIDKFISLSDELKIKYSKNDDCIAINNYLLKKEFLDDYEHKMIERAVYRASYFLEDFLKESREYSLDEINELFSAAEYVVNEGLDIVERKLEEHVKASCDA